jgi:hypothetical protein
MISKDKGRVVRMLPEVPVSWGELFDKITILDIKKNKIEIISIRTHIEQEIERLNEKATPLLPDQELEDLVAMLRRTNLRLWEIEDGIRAKEAQKEFDDEFISLARSVYFTNDERARVKQQINDLLNSGIQEYKSYQAYV